MIMENASESDAMMSTNPVIYDTAWLARVPTTAGTEPQWPSALEHLLTHQHADGSWGSAAPYAHDRIMNTLAALLALSEWVPSHPAVDRAVQALHYYAERLHLEPFESIGFEILLPALSDKLNHLDLPHWGSDLGIAEKLSLIGSFDLTCDKPATWWFSMEALPWRALAAAEAECFLGPSGAIATSPAASAAMLRAHRLMGSDIPIVANFLNRSITHHGSIHHVGPLDIFQAVWAADAARRVGLPPRTIPEAQRYFLAAMWKDGTGGGYPYSSEFPVLDGDSTAVGFSVLRWLGYQPSESTLESYFGADGYAGYQKGERRLPVSANVHALDAFMCAENPDSFVSQAEVIINALFPAGPQPLHDKWHRSPLYPTARLLPSLFYWRPSYASVLFDWLLEQQQGNGSWGSPEETAYALQALIPLFQSGNLDDPFPLARALAYLETDMAIPPLWIGKVLYAPKSIVQRMVQTTVLGLKKLLIQKEST